jgi:hypothetical protein
MGDWSWKEEHPPSPLPDKNGKLFSESKDEVPMTTATSLEEDLIEFCLLWCSHSLHRVGVDFAAGRMEVRQQKPELSKEGGECSRGCGVPVAP